MAEVTKSLPVKKLKTDLGPPRTIKFTLKSPFPNPPNVALLTLFENTGLGATLDGIIVPDPIGGTCDLQMGSGLFIPIWTWVRDPAHTQVNVLLKYDDVTLRVISVQVTSGLGLVAVATS